MPITISRLGKDHIKSAFESGDKDLDGYLKLFAGQNQFRYYAGTTYVATQDDNPYIVTGYYTLATTTVPIASLIAIPELRNFPYANLPAILLARLAVTKTFQGQGLGTQLIGDAVKRTLTFTEVVGCRALVVDAYLKAVSWYGRFGFIDLGSDSSNSKTNLMILDLRKAALAVKKAIPTLSTGNELNPPFIR